MKFFRLDLLTLLISLFILNSCKNQDTVGLAIKSSSQLNGSLIDTTTILTNTVLEDSVATYGTTVNGATITKSPLGYFNDPIFGLTVSDLATDLNLPSNGAYSLPAGTLFVDSARLVLGYQSGFYGDSLSSTYKVNVYQLNEKFKTNTVYYNTKKWDYNSSNLLGTLTFVPRPHDSIKIFNIIKGAPDTLIKTVPQIRIPISNSFINNYFFNAGSVALGSNTIFNNNIKGLYITLDRAKTTGPGGIIMFSSNDTLAVYYHSVNGAVIDTAVVKLPLSKVAASSTHSYSAAINTELNNTTTSRASVYIQGLAGLRAKISFPHLLTNLRSNLAKRDSDIIINRAELVVTPSQGSDIPYTAIPRITLYRLDLAAQRTTLPDATAGDPRYSSAAVFGGFYSSVTKSYHFIITGYLQDLILGKTVDYGTYIGAVDNTNTSGIDIGATSQVVSRLMAVGGNSASPVKMKLNIIYTKIAK